MTLFYKTKETIKGQDSQIWCPGISPEKAILQCRDYDAQIQFAINKYLFLKKIGCSFEFLF